MKKSDIRLLSDPEIEEKINIEKDNLQKMVFSHNVSPLENTSSIRHTRRLVSRLLTIQSNRQLGIEKLVGSQNTEIKN